MGIKGNPGFTTRGSNDPKRLKTIKHTINSCHNFQEHEICKREMSPKQWSYLLITWRARSIRSKNLDPVKAKHRQGKKAELGVLLTDTSKQVQPIAFDTIDADLVKKAAVRKRDGAGPSVLDANGWRRILITKQLGTSFTDFCKAINEVVRKLCTVDNLSPSIVTFLACCLIPFDKNPGLWYWKNISLDSRQSHCLSYPERPRCKTPCFIVFVYFQLKQEFLTFQLIRLH